MTCTPFRFFLQPSKKVPVTRCSERECNQVNLFHFAQLDQQTKSSKDPKVVHHSWGNQQLVDSEMTCSLDVIRSPLEIRRTAASMLQCLAFAIGPSNVGGLGFPDLTRQVPRQALVSNRTAAFAPAFGAPRFSLGLGCRCFGTDPSVPLRCSE